MAAKVRNNRFAVQWCYAKECWDALVVGNEVPPVPTYTIWEVNENGREKIIGHKEIVPMRVTCRGVSAHG